MNRVVVTGADGFTGPHLVTELTRRGCREVLGLGLAESLPFSRPGYRYRRVDVTDSATLGPAIKAFRPDAVFHLAGRMSGTPPEVFHANLIGTVSLLTALREYAQGVAVLVIGSSAEYGRAFDSGIRVAEDATCEPYGPYALSKYAATLAALDAHREWQAQVVVARPFNLVGAGIPSTLIAGALMDRVLEGMRDSSTDAVEMGRTDTFRDFIAVEDAVDAYIRLLDTRRWGEVFNVCSGQATSIAALAEMMLSFSTRPLSLRTASEFVRPHDVLVAVGCPDKTEAACGFAASRPVRNALLSAWHERLNR